MAIFALTLLPFVITFGIAVLNPPTDARTADLCKSC